MAKMKLNDERKENSLTFIGKNCKRIYSVDLHTNPLEEEGAK